MARYSFYNYGITDANQKYPKNGFLRVNDLDVPEGLEAVLVYNTILTDAEIAKYKLVDLNHPTKNLTKVRVRLGMRQAELARRTGLSLRTIQGWELNGMGGAAISKAYRVAKVLGCSIEDLMEEEDKTW